MNVDMLSGLLVTLSRHGLDYYGKPSGSLPSPTKESGYNRPFYPAQKHEIMELICRQDGTPALFVNDQWRICFRWQGEDALGVEIVDYH